MAEAVTFQAVSDAIRKGRVAPVYMLHGEEGFYIDAISKSVENLVPESDRDFNLTVLYASQTEPAAVVEACRRYPMMADRQVVILKETQSVPASFMEGLAAYAARPNPQTVFVVASRGDTVKGKEFIKAATASKAVFFESKKLKDNQIGPVIEEFVRGAGLSVDAKALAMLADHVGSDLSRLHNEVSKITVALPAGATVTPEAVERLIGVSKDFNNFELIDAVARRDTATAFRIAEYFRANPKNNPSILTGIALFGFFSKLLLCWYAPERTEKGMMEATGVRYPSALANYKNGMRSYSARQTINAISAIRRFDTRSKGIGSRANEYDLLRELLFAIFN